MEKFKCWMLAIIAVLLWQILMRMPKEGTAQVVRVESGSIVVTNTVPVEVQDIVKVETGDEPLAIDGVVEIEK